MAPTVNTGLKKTRGKAQQAGGEPVSLGTPSHPGPRGARAGPRPILVDATSAPLAFSVSPVSGSLKSGKVIVLSCRLSAMVLSKRLLPRPESLQNTAAKVSHWEGGRGRKQKHPIATPKMRF